MKFYQMLSSNDKKPQQAGKYPDLPSILQTKFKQNEKPSYPKPSQQPSSSNLRNSVLLNNQQQQDEQSWLSKLCACTKLDYYKDYFNVTNDVVQKRIMSNLLFWRGGFFEPQGQEYDFYGPFWIHTTVVFCLGAVHNMIQYQGDSSYDYDFEILGEAFFAMYVLGFGLPLGIGFIMKSIGVTCTIPQIMCLYGYSVSIYTFCILLCSFNICLLHWIFLGYGVANKIYFVFKNIHEGFEIPAGKKIVVTVLIVVEGALQFCLFKFRFIYCADQVMGVGNKERHYFGIEEHVIDRGFNGEFVHFRNYGDVHGEIGF